MANILSTAAHRFLYLHGMSMYGGLSGSDGQVGEMKPPGLKAVLEDLTGPGSQAEYMVPNGFVDVSPLTYSGWYNSQTLAYIQRLRAMSTIDRILNWGMEGTTVGAYAFGMVAMDGKIDPAIEGKQFTKFGAEHPIKRGTMEILKILEGGATARTATGTGTSLDNASSSASGGVAYFQALDVTGTPGSLVGKVAHSTDDSSWADLITFTSHTTDLATTAGQRSTVSGTVNRYLRAAWTVTTFTSTNLFVAFKRL